jgi:hypothetical protein
LKKLFLYIYSTLLISSFLSFACFADARININKKIFKKLKKKQIVFNDVEIKEELYKSPEDLHLDSLIATSFGDKFKRANVFEIYPLSLSKKQAKGLNNKQKTELVNYYDYARAQLEEFSGSKLLKFIKLNFDGDSLFDYAVVLHNKSQKTNHLAIFNLEKTLLLEDFSAGYIEAIQGGRFPIEILVEGKLYKFYSPVIRHIALDSKDRYISFNRTKKEWIIIETEV